MKRYFTKILSYIFFVTLLFQIGCNKAEEAQKIIPSTLCDSSNTSFNQIYNNLSSNFYSNSYSALASEVHSYDFEVTSLKTICKVGYQSQTLMNNTTYLIEIFNNTTNILVYSGSHIFSDTVTSYVSITPLILNVGNSYTIKRVQTNWNGNSDNKKGRVIANSVGSFNFPLTSGSLKVTNPKRYDVGNPENSSFALPYIDIVFEN